MLLTEYNEAEQRELDRAEGMAKGLIKGREEGLLKGQQNMLVKLVKRGRLTIKEAAEDSGMTEEDFAAQM